MECRRSRPEAGCAELARWVSSHPVYCVLTQAEHLRVPGSGSICVSESLL